MKILLLPKYENESSLIYHRCREYLPYNIDTQWVNIEDDLEKGDVIICEFEEGSNVINDIKDTKFKGKIIALTPHRSQALRQEALRQGAHFCPEMGLDQMNEKSLSAFIDGVAQFAAQLPPSSVLSNGIFTLRPDFADVQLTGTNITVKTTPTTYRILYVLMQTHVSGDFSRSVLDWDQLAKDCEIEDEITIKRHFNVQLVPHIQKALEEAAAKNHKNFKGLIAKGDKETPNAIIQTWWGVGPALNDPIATRSL